MLVYNGKRATDVEKILIDTVRIAYDYAYGFFASLEESVNDGFFAKTIHKYMLQRESSIWPAGFRDFGEVTHSTTFEELVDLTLKLRDNERKNRQIEDMCRNGEYL